MRKKIRTLIVVTLAALVLFVGLRVLLRRGPQTVTPHGPVANPEITEFKPQVAGAHTTSQPTNIPKDRPIVLVVSDGQQAKVISSPAVHGETESSDNTSPQLPDEPPSSPPPRTPQTVTVNLKGPLTATLLPGQHTPILTYELTDDAQFEWFPGVSAGWTDTPKQPGAPVWSTVLERQSSQPYIRSYVHFFISADASAKPGVYKVSVKVRLTPQVTLGVPVMVTIPGAPVTSSPAAARPG